MERTYNLLNYVFVFGLLYFKMVCGNPSKVCIGNSKSFLANYLKISICQELLMEMVYIINAYSLNH